MSTPSWIGRRVRRIEDPKLIRGQGQFLDDLRLEGTLHLRLVRSPHAHARVARVDKDAALGMPGVAAVLSADDITLPDLPGKAPKGGQNAPHPLLARGLVRYEGQPVAAILATSRAAAEDAADFVTIEYEVLEAVVDPFAALDADAFHPEHDGNVAYRKTLQAGDAESAFAGAAHVVGARIVNQRVAPMPLETRGVMASWDGTRDALTVWASTQVPHNLRDALAELLGLPENQVRVITPDVGGGFGVKLNTFPEDLLVAGLSRTFGRPVKWVESRSENLVATAHGRDQVGDLELALGADGHATALRGKIMADLGAYLLDTTAESPTLTLNMLQGTYRLEHFDVELVEVFTHKTPGSAYRGAGRPEATFYLERLMDMAARQLKLDPADIRRRNFIPPDAFPLKTATRMTYDSGDYGAALDLLLEKADYQGLRRVQAEAREQGRYLGIGLAAYVEVCAFGWDQAKVRVNRDGSAVVFTGTSPHGQGAATGFAQIVAEELGIVPEHVQVVHGDTLAVPSGQGTGGSRTLVVGGSSVQGAARKVREKLLKIAAHTLEAAERDLELVEGKVQVTGSPDKSVTVKELADLAYQPKKLPEGVEPGLEEGSSFGLKASTFPFGAHLCVVEVMPDSGKVQLLKYFSVDDCGTVMNPLLVEGQVHGGIAQALGQALYEGVRFAADGRNETGTLMDYALPRITDMVQFELHRTVTPSPTNPLGAKGVGEAGTIGGTPAVANAVNDALAHLGVGHLDMPFSPPRVWRALREVES